MMHNIQLCSPAVEMHPIILQNNRYDAHKDRIGIYNFYNFIYLYFLFFGIVKPVQKFFFSQNLWYNMFIIQPPSTFLRIVYLLLSEEGLRQPQTSAHCNLQDLENMSLFVDWITLWVHGVEKNLALIFFIVTTSILVSKWPHERWLSEYTLFDHIWNHFHRVNQVLLPKNAQK